MSVRSRSRRLFVAVAAASLICISGVSRGMDIIMVYDAAASTPPASDPGGANLQAIMSYIEGVYQDIFEDTHTLTITYRYGNQSGSTLAAHTLTAQSGGRETAGTIVFDPDAVGNNWYYDATPSDNSEFNMSQTLWRDLSAAQQTDLYNFSGTIPATFEAGYTGVDNGSNANVAGRTDLLSVAFHETGHALGMSASNTTTQTETADSDYDYDSINIFGATLAAEVADSANIAHLDSDGFSLMQPAIGTGIRRLPSHTDLLCMAAVHNYSALDIPRREFYGGSDWNTDANWTGNTIPGSADDAFVRNPGSTVTMSLSASGFAKDLFVGEGAWVTTNTNTLFVSNATIDGSGSALSTRIRVSAGGTLSATGSTGVLITNSGSLTMLGGQANLANMTVTSTGAVVGSGTINMNSAAGVLSNNGSIIASGGTLTITGAGALNLDGSGTFPLFSEPGILQVTAADSDMVIAGAVAEGFNGTINVGPSNSITFNNPWTLAGVGSTGTIIILGSDGVLNLNGGTTSGTAAALNGAEVTVSGDINVPAGAYGEINAPISFLGTPGGGAEVVAGGTLALNNNATFGGGSYTGTGRLVLDGSFNTVVADTTIDVATLDWDGFVPVGTFTVNNAVTATINSQIFDSYSGRIDAFGSLIVNSDWSVDGELQLNSGTVGGSGGLTMTGDMFVFNGFSSLASNTTFTSSSTVSGSNVSTLRLDGNTTFSGGSYTGVGTLVFEGANQHFVANTTIGIANLDMDGGVTGNVITVDPLVTATINSSLNGDAYDSTLIVNSGTFAMNGGAWTSSGTIQLNDTGSGAGRLTGGDLSSPLGGTILFNTAGQLVPNLSNGGSIVVSANSVGTITGDVTFASTTRVVVGANGNLHLDGAATYNGGSYTGPGTITQDGATVFAANTSIDTATYDWDGGNNGGFGSTTVNPGVTLKINSSVIDDDGPNDPYESTIANNSGVIAVNTIAPWPLSGTLNMLDSGAGDPVLDGSPVSLVGGTINSTGGGLVAGGIHFTNGTVNVVNDVLLINTAFNGAAGSTLNKIGGGTMTVNAPQSHTATSVLNVNAGTVNLNTDAGAGGQNLRIVVATGGAARFGATQHLRSLDIQTGARAFINGGVDKVLDTNALSILGTGRLDLSDNDVIVDYSGASPVLTIVGYVLSGYNGGAWNGNGIFTSAAAGTTGIGYADNIALGLAAFSGEPIDPSSVLLKYTYYGDANLDGQVDISDLAKLATNWQTAGPWINGDFDYSGFIDISDLARLATNWQAGVGAPLAMSFEQALASVGLDGVAVPEPVALGVLGFGALLLNRRTRRDPSSPS